MNRVCAFDSLVNALLLLNAVLTELLWAPDDLRECLDQMTQANQQLTQDARYQRISENLRRHGV